MRLNRGTILLLVASIVIILMVLIINSQRIGPREHIYLCLIIISLLAWGIDRGIMALQRHLFPHLKDVQA